MARIAIHGFGRIGRSLMKVALKGRLFTPVAVSDIKDLATLAALAVAYYDSAKELSDWKALGVDLVIDCTGRATTRVGAQSHLDRGAGRVIVSAPSKIRDDCDAFLLPGINLETLSGAAKALGFIWPGLKITGKACRIHPLILQD
jgi:glyceraldehyde 3-phosphate dehydrogenase